MTIASNDIGAKVERIENLIANFDPLQASKELLQFVRDFHPDKKTDAIFISAKVNQWRKQSRTGTASNENLNLLINQSMMGMLDLLEEVSFSAAA